MNKIYTAKDKPTPDPERVFYDWTPSSYKAPQPVTKRNRVDGQKRIN